MNALTTFLATTFVFVSQSYARLNVGVYRPAAEPVADVLYFHGYGDRFSNHEPLFAEWTKAGFRVVAFDLPSHGSSTTLELDDQSFKDLAKMAGDVERGSVENPARPLILAGWSLGGLLATRMAQAESLMTLSRKPSGLLLFAPGISVRACVGEWCGITNRTLTHDAALAERAIMPKSPMTRLSFAAHLLTNASLAWHQPLPKGIPTMVIVAGPRDRYVKSRDLVSWVGNKRAEGAGVLGIQCPTALHELDNELAEHGGLQVRALSTGFLESLVGRATTAVEGPCRPF